MNKYFKHFKMIMTHKTYVFKNCYRAGIPMRGLLHDLSKLSPTEYFESCKYYTGVSSPINEAKKDKGMSMAWFHHRGRNKHHWEYWVDDLSNGGHGTLMPYEFALEMICDWIGAGQAYEKDTWTFARPYDWFCTQRKEKGKIHPDIVKFVDRIFWTMKETGDYTSLDPYYTKQVYRACTGKKA